jgi:hypothetical protein
VLRFFFRQFVAVDGNLDTFLQEALVNFAGYLFGSRYANEKSSRQGGKPQTENCTQALIRQFNGCARAVESPGRKCGESADENIGDCARAPYPQLFTRQGEAIVAKESIYNTPHAPAKAIKNAHIQGFTLLLQWNMSHCAQYMTNPVQ